MKQPIEKFIPKERGSLPRVLLLDCSKDAFAAVKECGFQVFRGRSGFVDGQRELPRDSSEIDIVFWDTDNFIRDYLDGKFRIDSSKNDNLVLSDKTMNDYFSQIKRKGGFVVVFLGSEICLHIYERIIPLYLGLDSGFTLYSRHTHEINLISSEHKEEDVFCRFFSRYIKDGDLKFRIVWHSNLVGTNFYFKDSDNNHYAAVKSDFMISPKPTNFPQGVVFLLQEVLPNICSTEVYPDLHQYKWLEDDYYKPTEIRNIAKNIEQYKKECDQETKRMEEELGMEESKNSYLYEMLYKDDSDLFAESEKLKDIIKKVLKEDIGFQNVIDMDKERLKEGLALKEDLRVNENIFVEVKGTEYGPKENKWTDQLAKHVNQYCAVKDVKISALKQVLIFNHERRNDPRKNRTTPYENNPEFIKSCENDGVLLIPVFELYKMVMAIRDGKITNEEAQQKLYTSSGLLIF